MPQPRLHVLSNGLRIIHEAMPGAHSVSLSLSLAQGSRHESDAENGMTHFAEHLLFKGTGARHWTELSRRINLLGGQFNACTSADMVRIYGKVISRDLDPALRLIAEMFTRSTFPEQEVDRERGVILEEIAQYEDIPDDLCFEKFTQALLLPHPIGRPVIGTEELVSGFSQSALLEYWNRVLTPRRMLLSVAGDFNEAQLIRLCEEEFGALSTAPCPQNGLEPVPGSHGWILEDGDFEQVNFCLGTTGPVARHGDRFAWVLYDAILGGGMGSRLFDEVREKRGLAYSIGSSVTTMHEAGYLTISGSTRAEHATTAIEICLEEMRKLAEHPVSADELETARAQTERSHLLALESTSVRASLNGEREFYGIPHRSAEEVIISLGAVTPGDIQRIARQVVDFGVPAACLVGPLDEVAGLDRLLPEGIERTA